MSPYQKLLAKQAARIARVEEHAAYLLNTFTPNTDWRFTWNKQIHSLGMCDYGKREISLSKQWALGTPWEEVDDTIRHEIAHVIAGSRAGHGPKWKAAAVLVGATPETTYKGDVTTRSLHTAKYEMVDTTTGKVVKSYYRKPPAKTFQRVKGMYMRGRKAETTGKLVINPVCMIKELEL